MNDYEYITKFAKITVKGACEKVGVNRSNLFKKHVKAEKIKNVREEIENEIAKLYLKEQENVSKKTTTL